MMKEQFSFFLLFTGLFVTRSVFAYSGGAPVSVCDSMTPNHGASAKSVDTLPYYLLVSSSTYYGGQTLQGECCYK